MAQIITSVCDKHWADGRHAEPTETIAFEIDGEKFLLELCAEDFKSWLTPLKDSLLSIATKVDESGLAAVVQGPPAALLEEQASEPKLIKPEDGCEFCDRGPFTAIVGMISHIRTGHPDQYPAWKKRWDIAKADATA